jgi:hypothetical protein
MFTKPPFTYFEITLIQYILQKQPYFTKTTLGFSVITKVTLLFALLNFQKFHIDIHKFYTKQTHISH